MEKLSFLKKNGMPIHWLSTRFFWSTLTSFSSALSTIFYLYFIYKQPFANDFLYRYSFVGMWSGWANSFIYFLPNKVTIRGLRTIGLVAYAASIVICLLGPSFLYDIPIQLPSAVFIATLLLPILIAGIYGEQMRRANFIKAYVRTVIWNIALLGLALIAFLYSPGHLSGLYSLTALAFPLALVAWFFDPFFFSLSEFPKKPEMHLFSWSRVIFNPALLLLARLLFDQKVLEYYGIANYTFSFYTLSRAFSFMGTILFSYLTSHSLGSDKAPKSWHWLWITTTLISAFSLFWQPWLSINLVLIWGQWVTWLVSASLLLMLRKKGKMYETFSALWILDLLGRFYAARYLDIIAFSQVSAALTIIVSIIFSFTFYRRWAKSVIQNRSTNEN